MDETQDAAQWFEARAQVTLVEVARCSGIPEEMVRELLDYGAFGEPGEAQAISAAYVGRLREAARLHRDLELDTPTVALVLRFLERIEALEGEVRYLGAQVVAPRR